MSLLQHDNGDDDLAPRRIGRTYNRDHVHRGMLVQDILDVVLVDVLNR